MIKKKLSTQEQKKINYDKFHAWELSKSDEDFKNMVSTKGTLQRKTIAIECGFSPSSINSNDLIQPDLHKLEDRLRKSGVMPKKVKKNTTDVIQKRDTQNSRNMMNSKKLTRLEQEVTVLRAENQRFKDALERYELLEEVLNETGKMPNAK